MLRKVNRPSRALTPLLILLLSISSFVPIQPPASAQTNNCPGNLVTNGNFTSGLASWSAAYGTPDLNTAMGAQDPGAVGMWGNQNSTIGEALKQTLSTALVAGRTYNGSIWFKRANDPEKQPNAMFRLRASSVALTNWGNVGTIYVSPTITSTAWLPYTFTFMAPPGATILTINVENSLSIDDGAKTSYGQIDNVCIREAPSLACCECLGNVTTIDLSTGQGSPIDPLWNVNGGAAYTTPPYPGWTTSLGPAKWIQPVAAPTPASSVPPGVYKYTLQFNIPRCTIPNSVRLDVKWAADNSGNVFLDNNTTPVALCTPNTCFQNGVAQPFSLTNLGPGPHTLRFEVRNIGGPSGLIVNAKLTRQCVNGNPGPQANATGEPTN